MIARQAEVQELELDDLLVLEIFTLYGTGIGATLLAFICCKFPKWWETRKRNRVAANEDSNAGTFENEDLGLVDSREEIEGLCTPCRNAINEHFVLEDSHVSTTRERIRKRCRRHSQ